MSDRKRRRRQCTLIDVPTRADSTRVVDWTPSLHHHSQTSLPVLVVNVSPSLTPMTQCSEIDASKARVRRRWFLIFLGNSWKSSPRGTIGIISISSTGQRNNTVLSNSITYCTEPNLVIRKTSNVVPKHP